MTAKGCHIEITGIIQGVGFQPFVYRLAQKKGLHGWVANHCRGVKIEVQGSALSIREPRRQAAGLLYKLLAEDAFNVAPMFWQQFSATVSQLLRRKGHQVYHHQTVPANDGGIALGQIYHARCMENKLCV